MTNELMNKLLNESKAINNSVLKEALDEEELKGVLRHTFERAARDAMLVRPRRNLYVNFMMERYGNVESCTPELIEHWLTAFAENQEYETGDRSSRDILMTLSPDLYSSKVEEDAEQGREGGYDPNLGNGIVVTGDSLEEFLDDLEPALRKLGIPKPDFSGVEDVGGENEALDVLSGVIPKDVAIVDASEEYDQVIRKKYPGSEWADRQDVTVIWIGKGSAPSTQDIVDKLLQLEEGKIPTDQDPEPTKVKKLTEQDDEEEMPAEEPVPPPPDALDDEGSEEAPPTEDAEEALDMELVGSKGDTYFYMTTQDSDAGEREDLVIVDQEENKVFSANEAELDINDEGKFILDALREVDIDSVSYDLVVKYIFPMIEEEEEEEEEEEGEEGEVPAEELPPEGEEKDIPIESKKVSTTFERAGKKHTCSLEVDEGNASVALTVDDKTYTFTADLGDMYKEGETYSEEDLEDMATDVMDTIPPEDEIPEEPEVPEEEGEELPPEVEISDEEEEKKSKVKAEGKAGRGERDGTGPYKDSAQRSISNKGKRKERGEICPAEEEEEEEKKSKVKVEGKTKRGERDGTGPYKDSAQRSVSKIGRRKLRGEKCPAEDKKKKS